jgi:hypothetical protein
MNQLWKIILSNFLLGGFFVALLAVISQRFNNGLCGNLLGSLPIVTTYMIFYAYANSNIETTPSLIGNAIIGSIIYIIFNISYILIYKSCSNVFGSYFSALAIWIICQIILITLILPKFNVNLFKKDKTK